MHLKNHNNASDGALNYKSISNEKTFAKKRKNRRQLVFGLVRFFWKQFQTIVFYVNTYYLCRYFSSELHSRFVLLYCVLSGVEAVLTWAKASKKRFVFLFNYVSCAQVFPEEMNHFEILCLRRDECISTFWISRQLDF